MSEITVGVIGTVVLMFLFLLRVPVAFSMAIVGVAGFIYLTSPEAGLSILSPGYLRAIFLLLLELYPNVYTHGLLRLCLRN